MGTQNISIFGQIANWCGSVTGILTILIIATTANRMILTAIREKHGKESTFYRNSKLISGTIYLVFFVNCLGAIGRWLFGIITNVKVQPNELLTVASADPISRPWVLTAILVIIYITLISIAFKRLKMSTVFVATAIIIFGIQLFIVLRQLR